MIFLEVLLEMVWIVGWTFPSWLGSNLVYYATFGYVICEDEILAGIIGIVFLIFLIGTPTFFLLRR
jgi:hypothetical protein